VAAALRLAVQPENRTIRYRLVASLGLSLPAVIPLPAYQILNLKKRILHLIHDGIRSRPS
jgi:hypothetical protein